MPTPDSVPAAPSCSDQRGADDPRTRVAVLLALMRNLQGVMQAEAALLRAMRLDRLQELQAERVALAESHRLALRRLRQVPEALAAFDGGERELLEATMRDFQAAARRHADCLAHAHAAAKDMAHSIGESLGTMPRCVTEPGNAPQVVTVGFG